MIKICIENKGCESESRERTGNTSTAKGHFSTQQSNPKQHKAIYYHRTMPCNIFASLFSIYHLFLYCCHWKNVTACCCSSCCVPGDVFDPTTAHHLLTVWCHFWDSWEIDRENLELLRMPLRKELPLGNATPTDFKIHTYTNAKMKKNTVVHSSRKWPACLIARDEEVVRSITINNHIMYSTQQRRVTSKHI